MARTQTIETPDELKNVQRGALEQRDRFFLGAIQGHKRFPSKSKKKVLREQSLFGFLATFWRELSTVEKAAWKQAAAFSNLTNWQLFISDNAARLRHDLPLDVPPSDLWQVRAGQILIEAPATGITLKQEHPQTYFVVQKVSGTSWKRELVELNEVFGLPLELEIRYKASLTAEGSGQVARYMARVWTSYQGKDIFSDHAIDFTASIGWTKATLTISGLRGIVIGYTLYLEIVAYRGELLFDNIRAVHGGTNWARDPRCDAIDEEFTKAFAAVPPFWIPLVLPSGSTFVSQYPPSL